MPDLTQIRVPLTSGELVVRSNGDGTIGIELRDASEGRAGCSATQEQAVQAVDAIDQSAANSLIP